MKPPLTFVIVDDVEENRFLIAKTLGRKFPESSIIECLDSTAAVSAVEQHKPAAVIVHRGFDIKGPEMVRLLRQMAPTLPLIMVSSRETCPEAIEAGANAFLNYDAWLRIGTVVAEVLSPNYVKPLTRTPFKAASDFLGFRPGGRQ